MLEMDCILNNILMLEMLLRDYHLIFTQVQHQTVVEMAHSKITTLFIKVFQHF